MLLHIEYAWITNQIFTAFYQELKCFNHECQMSIDHSVFKQTVLSVRAHQLQQHTIEICCKIIQFSYQWTHEQIILHCQQNGLSSRHYVDQLCHVSLIESQHSISHMIIHWHIHMVHFLLFLHQNCSLVTGSLRKLYF